MKKILKLLEDWLVVRLKRAEVDLSISQQRASIDQWYIQAGKPIEDLSCLYPATAEDAAMIFEEWCKGVLSECCPDQYTLRAYAKHTAKSEQFHCWLAGE